MNTTFFNDNAQLLERNIALSFTKVWDYIEEDKSKNWTKAMNKILWECVKSIEPTFKVAACKLDMADCREWLYDFVCYENNNIGLNDIFLVAESEWKNPFTDDYLEDIQYDFEKLLLARSPYRLMIFEGPSEHEIVEYILHLVSVIKNCQLSKANDRYMFAGWNAQKQEFYVDLFLA